jgi:hypothetical protein
VCAAEQDWPDIAAERMRWQEDQKQLDPKRLVFIDETWAKTNMAPTHDPPTYSCLICISLANYTIGKLVE